MIEYPKTENLLKRDPDTHKLIPGALRLPEFNVPGLWLVTEKVDGTNIRIIMRRPVGDFCESVEVRGRSDRANTPKDLIENILSHIPVDGPDRLLDHFDCDIVTVYGEGYGAGIQKGGKYRQDKSIRIFDVTTAMYEGIGDVWWHPWSIVEKAAEFLNLKTVPVLSEGATIDGIVKGVGRGIESIVARNDTNLGMQIAEGVVARTDPYLYDWRGRRVMFKLKTEDFT